ncbi:MAG: glutathione S-transferase N-terminal domain-containing protein [Rhodospirillaceae bacterium]|jgi:glutathione S-transferase|nr:glutathione S-transferase N-terminal domain-containing protein [Rhodospirillaceae bacterium]
MKLRYSTTSPFVRKVHVAALELGLADRIELVKTNTADPASGLNRDNPLNKVPALALEDGSTLYDSRVICEYLDAQGKGGLFPPAGPARWTALRRQALADGMMDAAVLRMMETRRAENERSAAWDARQKLKVTQGLAALEEDHLGPQLDIGTLSIAIVLDYIDFRFKADDWRAAHPKLAAWHKTFTTRASLQKTLPHD